MINAMIATTLINANQNSTSPKIFTANIFSANMTAKTPKAGAHVGMSGNQNFM
ncbi:hypothetical protein D3C87_2025250 [compost metagenome]